jgi:WD40 repeat protein
MLEGMKQRNHGSPCAGRAFRTAIHVALLASLAGVTAWSLLSAARWRRERDAAERARAEAVERLEKVEGSARDRIEEIYRLHLAQAGAGRLTARAGRGLQGLEAVRRAAGAAGYTGLPPEKVLELRNVAVACLAMTDLRARAETEPRAGDDLGGHALDAALGRCAHLDAGGVIEVRTVEQGQVIRRLTPPETPVQGRGDLEVRAADASFTPDGRLLAVIHRSSAGSAGRLRVWDVDQGKAVLEAPAVLAMDLSGGGRALAACGVDGTVAIFRLPDATEARRIGRGASAARVVSLDAPGTRLAVAGDGRIGIFDIESGREDASLAAGTEVLALAWSHEGRWLAAAGTDRRIRIHDATGGTAPRLIQGHEEAISSMAWSPGDDLLASAGRDGTTRLWDTRSGDLSSEIPAAALRFHRDGKLLGTVKDSHVFGIWEIVRAPVLSTIGRGGERGASPWPPRESGHEVAFSRDGRWLASAGADGVRIWDPRNVREAAHLPVGFVESTCFDPRTGSLITFGETGLVRWPFTAGGGSGPGGSHDPAPWTLGPPDVLDLSGRTGPQRVSLDREGLRLAAIGLAAGQAIIFDAVDSSRKTAFKIGPDVGAFALSPDGRWAAAAGTNSPRAALYDLKTGAVARSLTPEGAGPADGVHSAVFSPDGTWLALGWTRGLAVWRAGAWDRGLEVKRPRREEGSCPVAFHPAAPVIALASDPRAVQLVELAGGREIATLTAPVSRLISWLSFSPRGDLLAAATSEGFVQIWDLEALREGLAALGLAGESPLPAAAVAAEKPAEAEVVVVDADVPGRRFRERRLAMLESDLASWTWDLAGSSAEMRSRVLERLADPLGDPVLRGVRDSLRARTLPPAEQREWESFVARARALHAELARNTGPPATPVNRRPASGATAENPPVLESSPFSGASPDAAHGWSRWQVRTVGGSFDLSPSIDVLSTTALTSLELPRGLLLPRTTCFWRIAHVGASGRISAWSQETPFTTASSRMRLERIDLSAVFNRDVVADPGDSKNDAFDPGPPPPLLIVQGFDGARGDNQDARGLPRDRLVGDHLLGDYRGLNSVQLSPGDRKPVRIPVPGARYAALRFLVSGGRGDSRIALKLEYSGGALEDTSIPCDDWTKDLPLTRSDRLRSGATAVWRKMDHIRARKLVNDDAASLFEVVLRANPARDLTAILLSPVGAEFERGVTRFNLFAVTAMTAE